MTKEKNKGNIHIIYHPKSPNASLDTLKKLAGKIKLAGPLPPNIHKFLDQKEDV